MIDFDSLNRSARLLLHCDLKPLQGDRFQPTGFPDLGAARYRRPDGTEMLLVESAQSIANRLEATIWDPATESLLTAFDGLPYVSIDCRPLGTTTSIQEFHRLNSPYIWNSTIAKTISWRDEFATECGVPPKREKKNDGDSPEAPGVLDMRKFYLAVFKRDPNSVLHGLFLEKLAGRLRMTRLLSGFIEAKGATPAESGGVKVDRVLPKPGLLGLDASKGFGNVPFSHTDFVAESITAYFNLDLALLRGYGLGESANKLLIALALFKIRSFLDSGLRLRAACDLKAGELVTELVTDQPQIKFSVPSSKVLLGEFSGLITACQNAKVFSAPAKAELEWAAPLQEKLVITLPPDTQPPNIGAKQKKLIKWERPTAKKGPRLVLTNTSGECVEAAKAAFATNPVLAKLIEEAVHTHLNSEPKPTPDDLDEQAEAANA